MDFFEEIVNLISLRQEGAYWDFKREWYSEKQKSSLLHDIICMANNLVNRDAYIIIGIDEENAYSIRDVQNDPNRKNTQMMVTFLRDKKFAGDIRPTVYVESIQMAEGTIDVVVVKNSTNTPFYLKNRFEQVLDNHIYTRIQDTNTPKDASADIHHVEYLWKKRFGMILTPLERMQLYLRHPNDWVSIPSRSGAQGMYYRYAPEFICEWTFESNRERNDYEFYQFAQMNQSADWGKVRLFYHQTLLSEFGRVVLDGGKYTTIRPETDGFAMQDNFHWDVSYQYLVKDTLPYIIHDFLYDSEHGDARIARRKHMRCILLFESEKEHQLFNSYAACHWCEKEKYTADIHLPYFPEIEGYNMEYFKTAYLNSQVLQKILMEFRLQQR